MAHTTAANKPITKDRIQFNDFIALIFIILFASVGGSKFFNLEKFKETFEFMPFMRPFAWILTIFIPLIEIFTAALFFWEKYRKTAIIISIILMSAFTLFTMFITKYAGTSPCTCGGIIQFLSWKNHLRANIALLSLGVIGLLFPLKEQPNKIITDNSDWLDN